MRCAYYLYLKQEAARIPNRAVFFTYTACHEAADQAIYYEGGRL